LLQFYSKIGQVDVSTFSRKEDNDLVQKYVNIKVEVDQINSAEFVKHLLDPRIKQGE